MMQMKPIKADAEYSKDYRVTLDYYEDRVDQFEGHLKDNRDKLVSLKAKTYDGYGGSATHRV